MHPGWYCLPGYRDGKGVHKGKRYGIIAPDADFYVQIAGSGEVMAAEKNHTQQNIGQSVCPYRKPCGGCTYTEMSYEEQLKEKQKWVKKLLGGYGRVEPIKGMGYPYHYRNKVHAVYGQKRNGQIVCGTYQEGTHRIVDIGECHIQDKIATEIILDMKDLIRSFKIKPYNEDTGYGLFRHVLVRRGFATGQVMVVLVLASPVFPSGKNLVKALVKKHPEITTVVMNINDRQTSMILGDREKVLYGKGYIEDELMGCTFRISAKSFYQVNPVQTKHLYRTAISYAGLTGKEKVVDAYCGIGTIGLIAAKDAGDVVSVELNRDAVRDAIINAKTNKISNVRFICRDAGEYMEEAARRGEKFDVVFMDPPRSGSSEAFLRSLKILSPRKVVYISCNPETLARDLKSLSKDYRVEKIQPVDMFPFTNHIECVVALHRVDM